MIIIKLDKSKKIINQASTESPVLTSTGLLAQKVVS